MNIFAKVYNYLSNPVFGPVIDGQVRHGLSMAAGYLVAHGVLQGSDTQQFVGLIMGLAVLFLSAAAKKIPASN